MKIIEVSGLDKSGKHTQTKMLTERLLCEGLKVVQSEFHRYDTKTGQLIMDWLTGKWNVNQQTIELIMTADKMAQQDWFNQLEREGCDYLILDRYILCQSAYGVANGIDSKWIVELQKYMRKPDLDIIIDIPAEVSMSRKGKHNNGTNDRYESDLEMLKRVRGNYISFSTSYSAPVKRIINGEDTVENIHENIYYAVREVFSL